MSPKPVPPALREIMLGFEAGEAMSTVQVGPWSTLGPDAQRIRTEVFVNEQRIPKELEWDAADATAVHAVAYNRLGVPVVQTLHNFRLMCPQATFLRHEKVCEDCLGRAFPWPAIVHRCYRGSAVQTAAVAGMVSTHWVNVHGHKSLVAPFGGAEARFTTNPYCTAVPRKGKEPIVLDFATSQVAAGKVRVANNKKIQMEPGLLIDAGGNATTDPGVLYNAPYGAILPFGLHKGGGLAVICDLLAGALTGGKTHSPRTIKKDSTDIINNMLSIIIDPASMGGTEMFEDEVENFITWVKSAKPQPGVPEVLTPGEPERARRVADQRELRAQILGRLGPVGLVVLVDLVAETDPAGIEDHREVGRPVGLVEIGGELPQHRGVAIDRADRRAFRVRQRRQPVIGAEDIGRAIDEIEVFLFSHCGGLAMVQHFGDSFSG